MRYGVMRATALMLVAGAVGGCSMMMAGNKKEVCAESRLAVEQYLARLKQATASNPAEWRAATDQLAVRFDALAKTAEDAELRKALQTQAAQLRAAGTTLGTGDAAALNKTLTETPARLGDACE